MSVFLCEKVNHNVLEVDKKPKVSQNSLPIVVLSSINAKFFGLVGYFQLLESSQEIMSDSVVVPDRIGGPYDSKPGYIGPSVLLKVDVHEVFDLLQLKADFLFLTSKKASVSSTVGNTPLRKKSMFNQKTNTFLQLHQLSSQSP